MIDVYSNHTYGIERSGQVSLQNECRLKLYKPCQEAVGQAPATMEPKRRHNMKGTTNKAKPVRDESDEEVYSYFPPRRIEKELEIPTLEPNSAIARTL